MSQNLRSTIPALLATVIIFGAVGCSTEDPVDRPGTWQATEANEHNLRAMVVNPGHLDRGVAAVTERGDAGANAVTRLLIERRRPLPNVRASDVGVAQQAGADPPLPGLGGRASSAAR